MRLPVSDSVGIGVVGQQVHIHFENALDIAHEIIADGAREAVEIDAGIMGVAGEVTGIGIVVEAGQHPALCEDIIDTDEAGVPAGITAGAQGVVPAVP